MLTSETIHVMDRLARHPLTGKLTASDLEWLAPRVETRSHERGEVISGPDQEMDGLIIVKEGRIRLSTVTGNREHVLCLVTPKTCHGLCPLLYQRQPHIRAEADAPVALDHITGTTLDELAARNPSWLLELVAFTTRRYQQHLEELSVLAFASVTEKVAFWLLRLANQNEGNDGKAVIEGLTHETLALMVGCSRESVSRSISSLRHDGAVSAEPGMKLVVDPAQLRQACGSVPPPCSQEAAER